MDRTESSRTVARRLLPHAAALLILMALVRVFVGAGVYTADENAYLTQVDVLSEQSSWLAPYPTDDILTQRSFAPLALSNSADDGWAAYSRHPLYIKLLQAVSGVSDAHGPVALSMFGVLVLAVSVGVVTRTAADADPRVGFWLAGLASPFFFHGQVVWAHAVAGGLVGVAMWGLFGTSRRVAGLIVAALSVAAVVALRTEALFVVMGLGAGVAFADGPRRERAIRAGTILLVGAAGFSADRAAEAAVLGATSLPPSAGVASEGFLLGRFQAVASLFLSPGGESLGNLARLMAVILLAAGVVLSRRAPLDNGPVLLAGLAAAAGVAGALAGGSYVGLIPAAPLFVIGLIAATQRVSLRPLWIAGAVVCAGVILTAPPGGGGLGWGGRYMLLTLPLIAPIVVTGLSSLREEPRPRALLAAAALVALAANVAGIRILEVNHRNSTIVAAQTSDALLAFVDSETLLVGVDLRVGRVAPESARVVPILSINDPDELDVVIDMAEEAGATELILVDLFDSPDIDVPDGWLLVDQELERSVRFTRIESGMTVEAS